MDVPSDILANRISNRLVNEGLLLESAAKKSKTAMASGKMRPEDWRLSIELATEKKEEDKS